VVILVLLERSYWNNTSETPKLCSFWIYWNLGPPLVFSTQKTLHAVLIVCSGTFVEIGIPGRPFPCFGDSEYFEQRPFYLRIYAASFLAGSN
jgi:hypothetical protein